MKWCSLIFLFCPWEGCKVLWWVCLSVYLSARITWKPHSHFVLLVLWMTSCFHTMGSVNHRALCIMCIHKWREHNSQNYCISYHQILLSDTEQQVHIVGCTQRAKSALHDCLAKICNHWPLLWCLLKYRLDTRLNCDGCYWAIFTKKFCVVNDYLSKSLWAIIIMVPWLIPRLQLVLRHSQSISYLFVLIKTKIIQPRHKRGNTTLISALQKPKIK